MGFSDALNLVENVIKKYEDVRAEAVKEVRITKVAAFNIVSEILFRAERILAYLAELEKLTEGKRVSRLCGNWVLASDNGVTLATRVKPALAVSYLMKEGKVVFADSMTSVIIKPSELTVKFRSFTTTISLTRSGIEENADILKSLGSKMLFVVDAILARIEMCGKAHGIRL